MVMAYRGFARMRRARTVNYRNTLLGGGPPPTGFLMSYLASLSNPPSLPTSVPDVSVPAVTGTVYNVPSGADLQPYLNAAQPGDCIQLAAGGVYTPAILHESFYLPAKTGSAKITIRSSGYASLPSGRVSPSHASIMAKLVCHGVEGVFRCANGAANWHIMGLEFTGDSSSEVENFHIIELGYGALTNLADVPRNITIDRCYIHGSATGQYKRGVELNGINLAVVRSHIDDIHQTGNDAQAVAAFNGPGPFYVHDNYLSASGEVALFGGSDPSITDLVPSDITFTHNYCFKPLSWKSDHPSYAGILWSVKNIFELKNARRVRVTGNIFENNWQQSQNGYAILITIRNQSGGATWTTVEDVLFACNKVKNVSGVFNILAEDSNYPSGHCQRVVLFNNLCVDVDPLTLGGTGVFLQSLANPHYLVIEHNTCFQPSHTVTFEAEKPAWRPLPYDKCLGFIFRNNLVNYANAGNDPRNGERWGYGITGSGTGALIDLTLSTYTDTDHVVTTNVFVNVPTLAYPAGNYFAEDQAAVGLAPGTDYVLGVGSPYRNQGSDGQDIGYIKSVYDEEFA